MKAGKSVKKIAMTPEKPIKKQITKGNVARQVKKVQTTAISKDAIEEHLPLSDLLPIIAFREEDLEVKKNYYKSKNGIIPFFEIIVKNKIKINIYGSHFESPKDQNLTYIIHNTSNLTPALIVPFKNNIPIYARIISGVSKGWKIESDPKMELIGDPYKTVFQGLKGDKDLFDVLSAVKEIKAGSEPSKTKFVTNENGKIELIPSDGRDLMIFLRTVIQTSDYYKLKHIEKCMKYLESPTKTKMERFSKSIQQLCNNLNRPPTPKEVFDHLYPNTMSDQYRDIYKDLDDLGLGWLINRC
jgi:hypothetical protein